MIEIIGKTEIDFIGMRKVSALISGILVFIGLIGLFQIVSGSGNLGIAFVGGTAVQLKFDNHLNIEEARAALENGGIMGADLQEITSENKLLIRIKEKESIDNKIADKIINIFRNEISGNSFLVESTSEIGPSIGKKLKRDTLMAIGFSLLGIIFYIALRFEFHFGLAAAVATIHDVIVVVGIMFLMNKEFTILTVTALLTLAGYSITDTVVIFDRIRENMKKRRGTTLTDNINRAINDVLGRTIVTSFTTLLVLSSLFFFGGEVLHDFALALILGVVIGNYSSLFVASPLVVLWSKKGKK